MARSGSAPACHKLGCTSSPRVSQASVAKPPQQALMLQACWDRSPPIRWQQLRLACAAASLVRVTAMAMESTAHTVSVGLAYMGRRSAVVAQAQASRGKPQEMLRTAWSAKQLAPGPPSAYGAL